MQSPEGNSPMLYFTLIVAIFIALYIVTAFKRIHGDVALILKYSPETSVNPFNMRVYKLVESTKK